MGTTDISSGNFLELVFENRFRQYGAYMLRRTYSERLMIASIIGVGTAIAIIAAPLIMQLFGSPVVPPGKWETPPPIQDTIIIDNTPEKKIEKKVEIKKEQTTQKPPKGNDFNFKITQEPDTAKDHSSLVQEDFKQGKKDGTDSTDIGTIFVSNTGKGGDKNDSTTIEIIESPTVWPKFPGNIGAWLGSHLKYPAYAKDAGISGTVHLSFIVDEEGNVSDIKIIRDIGGGCGESAVAAVKRMPRWIPGRMDGKPVKVFYRLPVRFTLKTY